MVGTSDNELVEQCIQGDNRAFDTLIDRYQLTMYRTALSIVKDPGLAKDITQNGFIKSWEKLSSFNTNHKFYSWLYKIIIHEALNKVRDQKNFERFSSTQSDGITPVHKMIKKEKNRQLYQAIEDLDTIYRSVIYFRYFEDLSYSEIAEVLEIDEKTVKSRLYSARMKLRETLFTDR